MAAPVGKLGDAFASREITVKKMLSVIGRDTSDLTFTAAAVGALAALPDDADVHLAWDALCEVYADVLTQFTLFTSFRWEIAVASGCYVIPVNPVDTSLAYDADVFVQPGTNVSLIAHVRVIDQPEDLNLVWLGADDTAYRLIDTITGDDDAFAGKGDVTVEVSYWMSWEHIPYVYRKYIFTAACRRFIQRAVGATDYLGFTQQDEQMAHARCQQANLEAAPCSIFTGSGGGERPNGLVSAIEDRNPY
jgi:hypothetical protein